MNEFLKRCREDRARALETISLIDSGALTQTAEGAGRAPSDTTAAYRVHLVREVEQLDVLIAAFENGSDA
jgi:hypothetical protein